MIGRWVRDRRRWVVCALLALAAGLGGRAAASEGLRELRLPPQLVESEPSPATSFELPPSSYPLQSVEQLPFHGAMHGFVNTTTGGLVFRMADLKLPGRMPIDFGRVYDSKVSSSLPPPPPGGPEEARWTQDLGKNWILGYTAYLVPSGANYTMATVDGDVIRWVPQGGGVYKPNNQTASKHLVLESTGPFTIVETQTDGTKWTYTYGVVFGASHALTKIEDREGNAVEMIYGVGYLERIENSDGAWIEFTRAGPIAPYPTRVIGVEDSTGRQLQLEYDAQGLLSEVTDVLGHPWTFGYGPNDKLTAATDPLGNVYLNATYDASHRVASYEADRGPWTFEYSSPRTLATDALGHVWTYHRNSLGMTFKVEEPAGGIHQLTFDAQRNPSGYTDPMGAATSWTYDANHLPTSWTPPGSASAVSFAYDASNLWVTAVTGRNGGVTTFTRDSFGRVLEEQNAVGSKWTATYDAEGDRVSLTLPKGNAPGGSGFEWTFDHDGFGQVATATDPTGRVFEFEYTAAGDLHKVRKPDHRDAESNLVQAEWTYTRDLLGRITAIADPLGNTWTRSYDAAGRLVTMEGPAGTRVDYGFDARFRVTSAKLEGGADDPTTTYGFDAAGRLATKTLPTGSTWTYAHDASSRLVSVTDPLLRTWTYTRDLAGRIVAIAHPGNLEVTLTRDAFGRLIEREFPGGRLETFGYDAASGRLSSAEVAEDSGAWLGRIEWVYDLLDRPTSVKTTIDAGTGPQWRELVLTYDPNGNRATLESNPTGETLSYAFDELDRLIATDSDLYEDWTVEYDADSGHRTRVESAERWKAWGFDPAGRMTQQVWSWPGEATPSGDRVYGHDAEGRAISALEQSTGLLRQTTLNALGLPVQLEVSAGGATLASGTYTYGPAGDLVARTRVVGAGAPEEMVFERDAAGRLVYARNGSRVRQYVWEDAPETAPGAAVRVWRAPSGSTEPIAEILYGFDGRLRQLRHHTALGDAPEPVLEYIWSPLIEAQALAATRPAESGELQARLLAADAGGYYAELSGAFADAELVHPVLASDRASSSLEATAGLGVPHAGAPFSLGAFGAPGEVGRPTLSSFVSGLFRSRLERDAARSTEQRAADGLEAFDHASGAAPDVFDDWLEMPLSSGSGHGEQTALLEQTGQGAAQSAGPAGAYSPAADSTGEWEAGESCYKGFCYPFWGEMVCAGCPLPGSDIIPDPDGTMGWSGYCCGWIPPGAGTGIPVCEYDWKGFSAYPESARYPDVSSGGVSLANGEMTFDVTDLRVFDPTGAIEFSRTYRSQTMYDRELGHNWVPSTVERIVYGVGDLEGCGTIAKWVRSDGSVLEFDLPEEIGEVETIGNSVFRVRRASALKLEIRDVSGTVREFLGGQLTKMRQGARELNFSYGGGMLAAITGLTGGIELEYYTPQAYGDPWRIKKVKSKLDPDSAWVEYVYNACGELELVKRPAEQLEPGSSATYESITKYTYHHPSATDCGGGLRQLASVQTQQVDPTAASPTPAFETQLLIGYHGDPEQTYHVGKVAWQCFGKETCDASSADFSFSYAVAPGTEGQDHDTIVTDHRLGPPGIQERHRYEAGNLLAELTEDHGGSLARTTAYHYSMAMDNLLDLTTFPDGTSQSTDYADVWGVKLPNRTTFHPGGGLPEQITYRTYELFRGLVRTETGPEAFPNGLPPVVDLDDAAIKPYTTWHYYDFDEPGPDAAECAEWQQYPCGEALPEADNGYAEGSVQRFGNSIKTRRFVLGDGIRSDGYLETTRAFNTDGRLVWEKGPDGVKTELQYYTVDPQAIPLQSSWGFGAPFGAAGRGPVAAQAVVASDSSASLTTRYAWATPERLLATKDPQGVVTESVLNARGKVLEQTVCAFPGAQANCADAGAEVLRTTKQTYDLRGRTLRGAVYAPGMAEPLQDTRATFDSLGRPTSATVDPGSPPHLNLTSQTFYDGRGRVSKTVSPAGRVTCFGYDALDRQLWIRKQAGATGASDCPVVPNAEDVVISTAYDEMDRPVIKTDATGVSTYMTHDAYGRVEYVSDAETPAASHWYAQTSYDIANRSTRERFFGRQDSLDLDPDPTTVGFLQVSWAKYDSLGRAVSSHAAIADGLVPQAVADLTPDELGELPTSDLATTSTLYDDKGRAYRTIDAGGRATDVTFDAFSRPYLVELPAGHRVCQGTGTICDSDNDCSGGTCAAGTRDRRETAYDAAGRPVEQRTTIHDPENRPFTRVSRTEPDAWGRPRRTIGAPSDAGAFGVDYAPADLITDSVLDPLDRVTRQVRRWQAESAWGDTLHKLDRVSEREHDLAGRVFRTRTRTTANPDTWVETSWGYDPDGLMTSMTDPEGNRSDWEYDDGLGRLTRMLYPQQDGKRQTVQYVDYDAAGRPTRIEQREDQGDTSPLVALELTYDPQGRLTSRAGSVQNAGAGTPEFFGTTQQTFVFDDLGRVVRAVDRSPESEFPGARDIVVSFSYDSLGRKRGENQQLPLDGILADHWVQSEYQADGFRTKLAYPEVTGAVDRYSLEFTPDLAGRIGLIRGPDEPQDPFAGSPPRPLRDLARYRYAGGSVWSRSYGNGTETRGYLDGAVGAKDLLRDGLGRSTGMRTTSLNLQLPTVTDFRYGFDRVGNLTHEQRRHEGPDDGGPPYRTRVYGTDRMGRLAGWKEGPLGDDPVDADTEDPLSLIEAPTAAESWSLDLLGNWQSRTAGPPESEVTDTYTTNALNQYSAVDPEGAGGDPAQPFGFDWLGQMRENASGNQRYVWDVFGRLTKIENASTGSLIARYRFDAFNRRVEKYALSAPGVPDATTRYYYDGWRAIEERAVDGTSPSLVEVVRARYGFGLALDEVLWMDRDDVNGLDNETAETGRRYFVHHDQLGSAVAVTDDPASPTAAQVVERFTYSAYGSVTAWWDPNWTETGYPPLSSAGRSEVGLPYLYTGQRFDPESGLQYSKHRVYDPAVGKFLRRDLVGYGDGPSLYGYARSNPTTWTDPFGLWSASGSSMRHMAVSAEARRHVVKARSQGMPTGLFTHSGFWIGDSVDDSREGSKNSKKDSDKDSKGGPAGEEENGANGGTDVLGGLNSDTSDPGVMRQGGSSFTGHDYDLLPGRTQSGQAVLLASGPTATVSTTAPRSSTSSQAYGAPYRDRVSEAIDDFYRVCGAAYDRCMAQALGADASRIPRGAWLVRPQIWIVPRTVIHPNGRLSGAAIPPGVQEGVVKSSGPDGTILVMDEADPSLGPAQVLEFWKIYAHELANIVDMIYFPPPTPDRTLGVGGYEHGNPYEPGPDPDYDTGQVVEHCMNGKGCW